MRKTAIEKKYSAWCEKIAASKDIDHLIDHFRNHVWNHYYRHDEFGSELKMKVWMAGVLSFAGILEKKFPEITTEDRLFLMCTYHNDYCEETGNVDPPSDIKSFAQNYKGDISKVHKY